MVSTDVGRGDSVQNLRELRPPARLGPERLDELGVNDLIGGPAQAVSDLLAVVPSLDPGQERAQTGQRQPDQQAAEQEDGRPR